VPLMITLAPSWAWVVAANPTLLWPPLPMLLIRRGAGPRSGSIAYGVISGFAIGALVAGVVADALGMPVAIGAVALLTAASGVVVLLRMRETLVRTQ
jgi:hypothetical protein